MRKHKSYDPFRNLSHAGVGLAGLSVATSVGAGIAAKAPAGTPSLTTGFNTIAGFAPIGVTAVGGMAVLNTVKRYKKKKYY